MVVLIISAIYTLVGLGFTSAYQSELGRGERIGLSFLLGTSLTTLTWFILYRLGFSFDQLSLLSSSAIVAIIASLINRFSPKLKPPQYQSPTTMEKQGFIIAAVMLLIAFTIAMYRPITAWDAIALYDFRAHTIVLNGDLTTIQDASYYISYPLYTSLLHASYYLFGATAVQGVYTLIFAAFLSIIYGRMYAWTNAKYASLTLLAVLFSHELYSHATFAYTNLSYSVYLVVGMLYAASINSSKNVVKLSILSAVLLGLSSWVRSAEPFWMLGALLIVSYLIKYKKYLYIIPTSLIIYIIRSIWGSYTAERLASLSVDNVALPSLINLGSVYKIISTAPALAKYIFTYLFLPYKAIWIITLISLYLAIFVTKNYRHRVLTVLCAIALAMGVAGVALFSTYFTTWDGIGDSARRMMLFIIPLSLVTAIYGIYLSKKEGHK